MNYPTEILTKYRKILAMCEGTSGPENRAWTTRRTDFEGKYPGIAEQARPKTWRELLETDPDRVDWRSLTPEELVEAREIVVARLRRNAQGKAADLLAHAIDSITGWLMGGKVRKKRSIENEARAAVEEIVGGMRVDDTDDGVEIRIRISWSQIEALGEWDGTAEHFGYELLSAIADDEDEDDDED